MFAHLASSVFMQLELHWFTFCFSNFKLNCALFFSSVFFFVYKQLLFAPVQQTTDLQFQNWIQVNKQQWSWFSLKMIGQRTTWPSCCCPKSCAMSFSPPYHRLYRRPFLHHQIKRPSYHLRCLTSISMNVLSACNRWSTGHDRSTESFIGRQTQPSKDQLETTLLPIFWSWLAAAVIVRY